MECVTGQGFRIDPDKKPHVRYFWQEYPNLGFAVGASMGEETTYVFVEYHSSGVVHGRPMIMEELRSKGAPV